MASMANKVDTTAQPVHDDATPFPDETFETDIDEILNKSGPFDRFQLILQITMTFLFLAITYNFVLSYFTGHDPPWRCVSNNSSQFCRINYNESISSDSDKFNQRCRLNNSEWIFTTSKTYSFVTEFALVCDKTSVAAFVSASYYAGGVIGAMFAGTTADLYGRKPVVFISLLVTICTSVGGSFVTSIWQLICINIIRGAAFIACFFLASVYQLEFVSAAFRSKSAVVLLLGFVISLLLIDVDAYFERDWRKLQIYAALPSIPVLVVLGFLPKSPRWLLAAGRDTQAARILEKISKFNGNPKRTICLKPSIPSNEKKYTYIDLFCHWEVAKLTLSIGALWITIAMVFYSIALESSNLGGDMYEAYALSTIADFPGLTAAFFLPNFIGRKKTILGGLCISGILTGSLALVPKSLSYRFVINIVLAMLARINAGCAINTLYTWTFELYPTVLRSQGMSISFIFKTAGLVSVPFITRVLNSVNYRLPFVLLSVLAILASISGLTLPETYKQPTRESYDDFFKMSPKGTSRKIGIVRRVSPYIKKEEI